MKHEKRERDPEKLNIANAARRFLELKEENPELTDVRLNNRLHAEGYFFSTSQLIDHLQGSAQEQPDTTTSSASPADDGKADYSLKEIGQALNITTPEARVLMNTLPHPDGMPEAELVRKQGFGETWRLNIDQLKYWHLSRS